MTRNPVATTAQRKAVLAAIDKAERAMLPGGLSPEEIELGAVQADLYYNYLKDSGELRRREMQRALEEQIKWGIT